MEGFLKDVNDQRLLTSPLLCIHVYIYGLLATAISVLIQGPLQSTHSLYYKYNYDLKSLDQVYIVAILVLHCKRIFHIKTPLRGKFRH